MEARLHWNLHCNIASVLRSNPGTLVDGSPAVVGNKLNAAFHSNQTGSIVLQSWEPDIPDTLGIISSDLKKTVFVNISTQITHPDLELVDFEKGPPGAAAKHALHSGTLTPFIGHIDVDDGDKFAFAPDFAVWQYHPLHSFLKLVGQKPFPFSFLYGWLHGRLQFDTVCADHCQKILDHFNLFFTYYMFIGLLHRTGREAESRPTPQILLPRTLGLHS